MLEKDAFLFGFVDMNDYSEAEKLKFSKHKAMLQRMHEKYCSITLAENVPSLGDKVKKIVENWNQQENVFLELPNPKRKPKPLPENEDHGQILPVQQNPHEGYWDDKNLPENRFMHLLTAREEDQDMSLDLQADEIEQLLECDDNQEEQSSYVDDLEKMLSNI
ncbi:hypothetical protein V2J09_021025 [Rumex salicifolius]